MNSRQQSLRFTKMQGVGNDFVVVDGRNLRDLDWAGLAREICDRRFGVGSDGLLVLDTSSRADVAMRMYNPDGTPDVCGNGLRCVARFVVEQDALATPAHLRIATLAGLRQADVRRDDSGSFNVRVEMGEPRFAPVDIPMTVAGPEVRDFGLDVDGVAIRVDALSTGTTHTVLLVDALPANDIFARLSPLIENHPLFPQRTSVLWTRVEARDRLRLRIWERGAGETWGCGTGACAAVVAARRHGLVDDEVAVSSKGGDLLVTWPGAGAIWKAGPAVRVFEGVYPLDPDGRDR
jgi:diaminopimelate epimerase